MPSIVGVSDHPLLMDEPAAFTVAGCRPGERVTVEATVVLDGAELRSSAGFEAGADGVVDPSRQPSLAGSYVGLDPFGLWWSVDPTGAAAPAGVPPGEVPTRVVARTDAGTAEGTLTRRWHRTGVRIVEAAGEGFAGRLYLPAGNGPFPAVVSFGGSGGGLGPAAAWAPVLASHGLATLAMAYFAAPGLPPLLAGIPVEVVERAVDWVRRRPEVGEGPVGVMGQSRGGELALLAASSSDAIGAVVVFAASGVARCGLGPGGPLDGPAWTLVGEPVPYAGLAGSAPPPAGAGPVALTPLFLEAMADEAGLAAAEIPVERCRGPVLAVSGTDDAMWPAAGLTDLAVQRARAAGAPFAFEHLRYDDAGHVAGGVPATPVVVESRHPVDGNLYAFGGTRAGNAAARADSWPRVVAFLREHLGRAR